MNEHRDSLGLDASCVAPGHWQIEGYEVLRYQSEFSERPVWVVRRFGQMLTATDTLREAWQWVGRAVSGGGSR